MKLKAIICILLFLISSSLSFGQMEQYTYKRELKGITGVWHQVTLPDALFGKVSQSLSDIRIFGITEKKDTIEAPYLLRLRKEKISGKEVAFRTLNTSHNDKGYYYTFEIPASEPINQINLTFNRQNFDWRLKLEGSQDQQDWFTIVDNYRILSIKNELTDFKFTTVSFPSSKYRYFRLLIFSKEKPALTLASLAQYEVIDGAFRNFPVKQIYITENEKARQNEIGLELPLPVPVSRIKIEIKDTFDYYRPVTIKYLVDSFQTEQGWKYNYQTLTSGTLHSLGDNEYKVNSRTVQKLKVLVDNQDNQPLNIEAIELKGYVHELIVRFTESADYFLVYGNHKVNAPDYDITRFRNKIPKTLNALVLSEEQVVKNKAITEATPLFQNQAWLWALMLFIILVLGWFTLTMIRKK